MVILLTGHQTDSPTLPGVMRGLLIQVPEMQLYL
ncbi:hypothetical protein RSAG8_08368, partial [Rhizoctonia solani AG-8 WAC10335]